MKTIRILILEDDLKALSIILDKLFELEEELFKKKDYKDFAVTIFSESPKVEEYVNKKQDEDFDIILLDRDCKLCGSFHCLDFDKFNLDKIISISSTPEYNEQAKERGVEKIVWKDFKNLDVFADEVVKSIEEMI